MTYHVSDISVSHNLRALNYVSYHNGNGSVIRTIPICHTLDAEVYRPGPEVMGHGLQGGQLTPGGPGVEGSN